MDDIVIVSAARTAVGSFNGALSSVHAHDLGAVALQAAFSRGGIEASVRTHLEWVVSNEERARYLFHCREYEVIEESRPSISALNEQFYSEASAWLHPHVEERRIKPLPPRLCQALWMGPSVEYARLWLARPTDFDVLGAAPVLAKAAWTAVKV